MFEAMQDYVKTTKGNTEDKVTLADIKEFYTKIYDKRFDQVILESTD